MERTRLSYRKTVLKQLSWEWFKTNRQSNVLLPVEANALICFGSEMTLEGKIKDTLKE